MISIKQIVQMTKSARQKKYDELMATHEVAVNIFLADVNNIVMESASKGMSSAIIEVPKELRDVMISIVDHNLASLAPKFDLDIEGTTTLFLSWGHYL